MSIRALHRQLLAGIVLFALLLQTVLPAIAGVAPDAGNPWVKVCAASGAKWIKLHQDASAGQHVAADHCMLCAATGAVPEFDASPYLRAALAEARAAMPVAASFATFPGHILRSRAPPSVC